MYPERPVLITNASSRTESDRNCISVDIFPESIYVPNIRPSPGSLETLVQLFTNPKTAFVQKGLAKRDTSELVNRKDQRSWPIRMPGATILICGHNTRDTRCGILGPLLRDEFCSYLNAKERSIESRGGQQYTTQSNCSRVALTSHIGGHAFAGNVVIYLPKTFKMPSGELSPLAGMGIWYGRVEPRHVWGIMEETVQRGSVIQELLRGIHRPVDIGDYDWIDALWS